MAATAQKKRQQEPDAGAARRKRRPFPWAWTVLIAIPVLLCGAYYAVTLSTARCDWVSASFSTPVRVFMGKLSNGLNGSYLPPSLTEILYTLLGVAVIAYIIITVVLIVRKKGKRLRTLGTQLLALAVAVAYIWTGMCWLWNVEYHCSTFGEQCGLEANAVAVTDLKAAALYFADMANDLSGRVYRDEELHLVQPLEDCFSLTGLYEDGFISEFPCLGGYEKLQPKAMIYSNVMSMLGYTGLYLAFTGEANINTASPRCLVPFTVAHEMAHQRGVALESEANFVGIAACVRSGNDLYAYSGSLMALMELMDALYGADKGAWEQVSYEIGDNVRQDWIDNNDYWNSVETTVTAVADTIYDGYLKSNGQELGIRSYGACVDLLVAWYQKGI